MKSTKNKGKSNPTLTMKAPKVEVKKLKDTRTVDPITGAQVIKTIQEAARNLRIVTIYYIDSNGQGSLRNTEPYEIKDNKYWAYCLEKGSIRQFHLSKIFAATLTDTFYRPRWPVKIL